MAFRSFIHSFSLVVAKSQCRGVWNSALYGGGAQPLVSLLKITTKEFREMCDRVEKGKKSPRNYFDVDVNVQLLPNLKLFKSWGLDLDEQKMVVRKYPKITTRKGEDLMAVKAWYTEKFQLDSEEWKEVVVKCPRLLNRSREEKAGPLYTALMRAGFSHAEIRGLLVAAPSIFHHGELRFIEERFLTLRDLGLNNGGIIKMLMLVPEMLGANLAQNLKPKLRWFQKELSIKWDVMVEEIMVRYPDWFWNVTIKELKENLTWLKEQGFSKEECSKFAVYRPEIFLKTNVGDLKGLLASMKELVGR
ncbi:hypothetical protein BSKO_00449 [Bryopsis sp. KO-2023]|nr:hypothetical protein BSKO_00449 [Bryopsis sp. KO-2023]